MREAVSNPLRHRVGLTQHDEARRMLTHILGLAQIVKIERNRIATP